MTCQSNFGSTEEAADDFQGRKAASALDIVVAVAAAGSRHVVVVVAQRSKPWPPGCEAAYTGADVADDSNTAAAVDGGGTAAGRDHWLSWRRRCCRG